jgi:hypothetical protein
MPVAVIMRRHRRQRAAIRSRHDLVGLGAKPVKSGLSGGSVNASD